MVQLIILCRWLQTAAAAGNMGAHLKQSSSYAVSYTMGWEPYIVVNKKLWNGLTKHGMFDQRFRVKGWDKASFVYEVATRFVRCFSPTATLSPYLAEGLVVEPRTKFVNFLPTTRGYKFRTLHGVFLVHATDHSLKGCPAEFGAFCFVASTADSSWQHSDESQSARNLFVSFVLSLSEARLASADAADTAEIRRSDVKMEAAMQNKCLIFPFILLHRLPVSFMNMWLDIAYQAHAQVLKYHSASFITALVSNSSQNDSATSEAAQRGHSTSRDANPMNWLTTQHWETFANSWCVLVPALLGIVFQFSTGEKLEFHVDTRIWEAYNATSHSAPLLFRHYIKDIHRLTQLYRIQMGANEIVLSANVQLARVCTETDDGSQLWQCATETFIENAQGHVILHLHRESLLVEHQP